MVREKRQFTRIALNIQTALSLYQIDTYHTGAIANISLGGCYFPIGEELPVGEKCHLTITVGEGLETEILTLSGQIVRSDAAGAGIQFIENTPHTLQQLEKIITRHLVARSSGETS